VCYTVEVVLHGFEIMLQFQVYRKNRVVLQQQLIIEFCQLLILSLKHKGYYQQNNCSNGHASDNINRLIQIYINIDSKYAPFLLNDN